MDEQQKDRPDGLVITDDSGNYYYLRPEVLADAKMPDDDLAKLKAGLAKESSGAGDRELSTEELDSAAGGAGMGGIQLPGVKSVPELGSLKINSASLRPGGRGTSYSTVMCPW